MTQNFDVFAKRKGQSAIEYLMTYGWMLLVVAIVGGAIFATVQGQCTASTSGFSTSDVRVADFGLTNGNSDISFELRNAAAEPINLDNVTISNDQGQAFVSSFSGDSDQIAVGGTSAVTADGGNGFTSVQGCNTFDLNIQYDVQNGIQNQSVSGSLTNSMQFS